jgi:pimeloyl-ACP methyl ester carboxylesterase
MSKLKTFVLVHGAGHGGWAWRRVSDILTARGHRVYAPSLTGLADRSHLMSGSINLDTHVQDIVNLFEWEDIDNAVLAGHSYGGWVISGAIEKLLPRVPALAYIDAFLPENGQRGFDFTNAQQQAAILEAQARGEVSRPGPTGSVLKIQSPEDRAWVDAKITPQPLGVSLQPVALSGALERVPAKLYIRTPLFPQPVFDATLARCESVPGWRTLIMRDCGHDPMIDQPEALAEALDRLS